MWLSAAELVVAKTNEYPVRISKRLAWLDDSKLKARSRQVGWVVNTV